MSRTLLFEIGTEEIPSAPLYTAVTRIKRSAEEVLREARLEYGKIETFGSPRRLVLRVTDLAERQEDLSLRVKGPAAKVAFDEDGNTTKAAQGFARGQGIDPSDLELVEDDKGSYVYASVERVGEDAAAVLPALLGELAAGIDWSKSMRWGDGETRFARPVRWLVALFGDQVLNVEFAGLSSSNVTRGLRFLESQVVEVASADSYAQTMESVRVVFDQERRAEIVREGIEKAAAGAGATAVVPEKVFAEVVNLVEWPTVAVGRFDTDFLEVPREVLETAMESHQRYFPLQADDGKLMPGFVVAHNGDPERTEVIVSGHERVIRARLADAAFFYREDLSRSFEDYVDDLDGIVFQEKLGTLADKVARIEALTEALAKLADVDSGAEAEAVRAAHLCKNDLVTHLVIEFPSLQGVMGCYYAAASDESDAVASAVLEHYLPRHAGDALPETLAGSLISVADKLDTMVGIFGIGMPPTGSADPYALRRGAIGILSIILGGMTLTLDEAIAAALVGYSDSHDFDNDAVGGAVKSFIVGRLEGVLRERGHAYDTVAAVLEVVADDPADALARCEALTPFRSREDIADLSVAFSRAKNLAQLDLGVEVDTEIMGGEEAALTDALVEAEQAASESLAVHDYTATFGVLASLRGPIDAFFDAVMVMDDDIKLRENRLRLLNRFVMLFSQVADFSKLEE